MPIWAKVILVAMIMLYMIVNEGERIETRRVLEENIKLQKQLNEEFSYKVTKLENKNLYYNEHEHYYNGKSKP